MRRNLVNNIAYNRIGGMSIKNKNGQILEKDIYSKDCVKWSDRVIPTSTSQLTNDSDFQTGQDVETAIDDAIRQTTADYTIAKLRTAETGYATSYVLLKDNVQVGDTINIPKDMVVSSGEVKTVTTANVPYQGAVVGDKYIDLTIANTAQNHIYIPVKDLVDVYTAGNGIDINGNNTVSVKVDSTNANGLSVGANGLSLSSASPSTGGTGGSAGAMTASDKEKLDGIEAGANDYTHPTYTATTGSETDNQTPSFGGTFNVSQVASDAEGHVTSQTTRTVTIPSDVATTSAAGLMSAADKDKLDGIEAGAEANVLEGVQVNGTDLTITGKKVNITTNSTYNESTNKIATMSDIGIGQGYGICQTNSTSSGATMTASLTGYELSNNSLVAVKFDYTVPVNAKLDINSQGAKNIQYNGENITAGVIQADNIAQFFYDGTYYHLVGIIPNIVNGTGAGAVKTRSATLANGTSAFAEGTDTTAHGNHSHAEGSGTSARALASHSEGANGLVTGNYSHIEGGGTVKTLSVTGAASATTYTTSSAHGLKIGDCVSIGSTYRYVTAIPSTTSFTLSGYLSTSALSGATVNVYTHFVYNESSHVEGTQNACTAKYGHAEGGVNSVMAQYGHAEGYKNIVYGSYAHAEGDQNYVNAIDGHVEGRSNYVLGTFAHAEGNVVLTGNAYTHAEGSGQRTSKSYTLSGEANATTYTTSAAHGLVIGDVILLVGSTSGGTVIDMTKYVTEVPSTTTLTLNSTIHATESVSGLSVTVVLGCSIGSYSHSEGYRCNAIGSGSHVEGALNKCFGAYGHIEGSSNIAYGNYVHAEGYINTVNASCGHSEGNYTYCIGSSAHTEGSYTTTGGSSTHAEGVGARTAKSYTLSGDVQGTTYTTSTAHDLQVNDIIHVIGGSGCPRAIDSVRRVVAVPSTTSITLATKLAASASPTGTFGSMSVIKVDGVSLGSASHSEGRYCNAVGAYSHVEGQGTRAYNAVEHAEGNYNLSTRSSTAAARTIHSIGIGSSDSDRKNALEVKFNGDMYVFGAGGYNGANYADAKSLQTLINEQIAYAGSGIGIYPLVPQWITAVESIYGTSSNLRFSTGLTVHSGNVDFYARFKASTGIFYMISSRPGSTGNINGLAGSTTGNTMSFSWNGTDIVSSISRTTGNVYRMYGSLRNGTNMTLIVVNETDGTTDVQTGTCTEGYNDNIFYVLSTGYNDCYKNNYVYQASIMIDGVAVMNYIPAKWTENNTDIYGFYDLVSHSVKTTSTGTTLGGSPINVDRQYVIQTNAANQGSSGTFFIDISSLNVTTTTWSDIWDAYNNNDIIIAKINYVENNTTIPVTVPLYSIIGSSSGGTIMFTFVIGTDTITYMVTGTGSNVCVVTQQTQNFELRSNKVQSVIANSTSTQYYPSTKAVFDEFQRKPVVVWEETTPSNYLSALQADLSASPAWQLTNLDLTPYKRIKIYSCAGRKSSGVGVDASTTPAMVLEMTLDSRAAIADYGGNYVGSTYGQKPNDANRFASLTCAVSADKTSFVVLRQTNIYGTGATSNSDCNANVFLIEGYYD